MNISMDGSGYVVLDTTFNDSNINTMKQNLQEILDNIDTFDPDNIQLLTLKLNELYQDMVHFQVFLNNWGEVKSEVVL